MLGSDATLVRSDWRVTCATILLAQAQVHRFGYGGPVLLADRALGPGPHLDEPSYGCLAAARLSLQDGLVDVFGHLAAQGWVEDRRQLGLERIVREYDQCHGLLQLLEEYRVGGRARSELGSGKGQGRRDVAIRAGRAAPYQLHQLQPEQGEVESRVSVQNLLARLAKVRLLNAWLDC